MKKRIVSFLAIFLSLSLSVTAFADSFLKNDKAEELFKEWGLMDEDGNITEDFESRIVVEEMPEVETDPEIIEAILREGHRDSDIFAYDYNLKTKEKTPITYGDIPLADYDTLESDLEPCYTDSSTFSEKREYDPEAYRIFHDAGLIDSDGNFDWDKFFQIPAEEMPEETEEINLKSPKLTDNRTAVANSNVTNSPYRWTCYVLCRYNLYNEKTGEYETIARRGSGCVAGSNLVLTAAHVIEEQGVLSTDIVVLPAQTAYHQNPYGACVPSGVKIGNYLPGSVSTEDWGGLEFDKSLGLGCFGLRALSSDLSNTQVTFTGYPAHLQGEADSSPQHYNMYTCTGDFIKQQNGRVYVQNYISGGNSGGPMHQDKYLIGVVTSSSESHSYGIGLRINATMKSYIMAFR